MNLAFGPHFGHSVARPHYFDIDVTLWGSMKKRALTDSVFQSKGNFKGKDELTWHIFSPRDEWTLFTHSAASLTEVHFLLIISSDSIIMKFC